MFIFIVQRFALRIKEERERDIEGDLIQLLYCIFLGDKDQRKRVI